MKKGQKMLVTGADFVVDMFLGGEREVEVVEVAPKGFSDWEKGVTVKTSKGVSAWLYQKDLEPIIELAPPVSKLKNTVEIHGDIALIHVNRKGYTRYLVVDAEDLPRIERVSKNRINIDSGGYAQHRTKEGGSWSVFQLHREIADAFDYETVGFKNGNKLDLRKKNLYYMTDFGKVDLIS